MMIGLFNLAVVFLLWLDLKIIHQKATEPTYKDSLKWSLFWVILALLFASGINFIEGTEKSLEFLAGYVLEKSLSIDNIFVIAMIFSAYKIPLRYQHQVLFWGILGAIVFRFLFILVGVYLLEEFYWLMYVFGGFLIFTGIRMFYDHHGDKDFEKGKTYSFLKRFIPMTPELEGDKFFIKKEKTYYATPLFVALVFIELADLVFALDSIPAVLALTTDPFIVYTSNIFAILGLRSLYFLLAGALKQFTYLKVGLAVVLIFVGAKMLTIDIYKIPISISLSFIVGTLVLSIGASWIYGKKDETT